MKTDDIELHKTFVMVKQFGLQETANRIGITRQGVEARVKRLANIQGKRLFFPYDYNKLTRAGEQLYREINRSL